MTPEDSLRIAQQMDHTTSTVTVLLYVLLGGALYMLPTMIAKARQHAQLGPIILVNLLLGWTCIGWIAALVWTFTTPAQPVVVNVTQPGAGKFCPKCGTPAAADAGFCGKCGAPFAAG